MCVCVGACVRATGVFRPVYVLAYDIHFFFSFTKFFLLVVWFPIFICNWVKRDQLDVTCFIISLFNAQHVSDVNTSILRSLLLICWVISWVVLIWFDVCWSYVVVWLWWCGIRMQAEALVPQPASISTCIIYTNVILFKKCIFNICKSKQEIYMNEREPYL